MKVKIIREKITRGELERIAAVGYGEVVKIVVDIKRGVLTLGGDFHSEGQEALIKDGSDYRNLWGANIYLYKLPRERLDFSTLMNIRPTAGNRSMEIQDQELRNKVRDIIEKLVPC